MYLMIRNPGIASHLSFTLVGASTSRGNDDNIGCFGSGSKHSVALLLRNSIPPVIFSGNLKMEFSEKIEYMKENQFRRIVVKYSGKTEDGRTKNNKEELSFSSEWGDIDWTDISMAIREFVSNAIDACTSQGLTHRSVTIDVVEHARAKSGTTSVYLPWTPKVKEVFEQLGKMFLHFNFSNLLDKTILPKRDKDRILVYKKGVLVYEAKGNSLFDYNLNNIKLDESRNADYYAIRSAIAQALRDASVEDVVKVIQNANANPVYLENEVDDHYFKQSEYSEDSVKKRRAEKFAKAFTSLVGDNGIVCSEERTAEIAARKGMNPLLLNDRWVNILTTYGVPTDKTSLNEFEQKGRIVTDATDEMKAVLNKVWGWIHNCNMHRNKEMPKIEAFIATSDALGFWKRGGDTIWINTDQGGITLQQTILEECAHYVTEANDGTRELQEWMFRLSVEMMNR